jgi:hypothetical protein
MLRRVLVRALALAAIGVPAAAAPAPAQLDALAGYLAHMLATACPVAPYTDLHAFRTCEAALRKADIPFADAIAWGGDQPDKPIRKKGLTHFNGRVFQTLYLPLFTFTGNRTVTADPVDHVPVLQMEAYFRNALPSGEYPYPFWHSAAKWADYEAVSAIRFYLNPNGKIFVATRGTGGNETNRGAYTHVTPPAFDGNWQWTDASGQLQPRASLFSNRYSAANPVLPRLDQSYRAFAMQIRTASCLECHTPANKASADRLVLLQTPIHASGEINNVIKEVRSGEMPEDELGLRKQIDPKLRAAILRSALAFRDQLSAADAWEQIHVH